ncbi:MAG: sugar nucleotide-binding protein [Elusimicrobia bacterium]|nr:sugar nucleotide-binding protein [Elusimicrobiota bacterium]
MKYIVFGASGFLGRHFVQQARQHGHEVLGTYHLQKREGLLPFNLKNNRLSEIVPADFFSSGPVCAVLCSFISQIDDCFRWKDEARLSNVDGMIRLINDLCEKDAFPVFLSTCAVFDGTAGYYSEESPTGPINEYGRQKLAVEEFLRAHGMASSILRCDKLIGDDAGESHMLSEWYRWANEGRPLVCIQGQMISPTLVTDVARAIVVVCEKRLTGVFHVANPQHCLREELALEFLKALNLRGTVVGKTQQELGFADLRPLKAHLNPLKFIKATGFQFTPVQRIFEVFAQSAKCPPKQVSGHGTVNVLPGK